MKWFAAYDSASGQILQTGCVPNVDIDKPQGPPGCAIYKGYAQGESQYIDLATLTPADRMDLPHMFTVSAGAATLSDLPVPCRLRVLGQTYDITDSAAELTFDAPGTYSITLESEPKYFPLTLELEIP